jgi:hypothetical protein
MKKKMKIVRVEKFECQKQEVNQKFVKTFGIYF